jgi:hypothetical protein
MLGDPHPQFPLLYVVRENEDGSPAAYMSRLWWNLDEVVILGQASQCRPHRQNCIDNPPGISDTPAV